MKNKMHNKNNAVNNYNATKRRVTMKFESITFKLHTKSQMQS